MTDFIIRAKKVTLLIGDIFCLYFALFLTLILRYGITSISAQWENHFWPFTLVIVLWLIVFYIGELYELKFKLKVSNLLGSLIKLFSINAIIAVTVFYFLSPFFGSLKPQRVLVIDIIISLALIFLWMKIFPYIFKSSTTAKTLLIGYSPLNAEISSVVQKKSHLGYELLVEENLPENINDYCRSKNINLIISSELLNKNIETSQKLYECIAQGIDVLNINRFYERITAKIPVEDIEYGWFFENVSQKPKLIYDGPKRAMDIVVGGIGCLISLIFYPFVYIAIKLDDGGCIFSIQERVGKNNKPIKLLKFRTMSNANDGGKWGQAKNTVTRVGKFLRKSRIDELPQLWNVLKGDLSLIGPRPEFAEPVALYSKDISYYNIRHLIKPGLSGWAQINQEGEPHHGVDVNETRTKFSYDLYYIKNRNFVLDLSIALKTIKLLLMRKGV